MALGSRFTRPWGRNVPDGRRSAEARSLLQKRSRIGRRGGPESLELLPGQPPNDLFARLIILSRSAIAILLFLSCSAPYVQAQRAEDEAGRPLIERVRFDGVEQLSERALRSRIVNQPTQCRGFLLLDPLCWATRWHILYDEHFLDRDELRRDELRLMVHYFRQGYRQARVTSSVLNRERGVEIVFRVAEGPPTYIASIEVEQTEEVLTSRQIRRSELPREGRRLDLDEYELALAELHERLGAQGYIDAEIRDSISIQGDSARVVVELIPNQRAVVGEFAVEGNEDVADRTIIDALRLREGGILRAHYILDSQRSLYESNLFFEVRVTVPEQDDSVKTVRVDVREAPPRLTSLGGGFNTVEFFQTEAGFTHHNWLGGGRRLELRARVGNLLAGQLNDRLIFRNVLPDEDWLLDASAFRRPTWHASADVRQPAFRGAANVLSVGVFAQRAMIPAIVIDNGFGGEISLSRRLTFRTPLSLTYRYEITSIQAGDLYFCVNHGVCDLGAVQAIRGRNALSPLVLNFFSDQSDDPLSTRSGFRVRGDLEHATAYTLSDFRYNRFSAEGSIYIPFGVMRNRILMGRARAGIVRALEGTDDAVGVEIGEGSRIHPRKRFFAGGSRSVRGYWENQLGPRVLTADPEELVGDGRCAPGELADGTCDPNLAPVDAFSPQPVGGRSLVEGTIEYRFLLTGQFFGAGFVDAGVVGGREGRLFSGGAAAVTPGIGVRFLSPFGTIRADLGFRPRLSETLPVVTEVMDNGVRRLVELDQPRVYNPAAGGNFFTQILARLRFHLAIGEPF
jgi:outer membrane protein insertion porin family